MNAFIGHARDEHLRRAGTSGGVGSALLSHLFATKRIGTSVSFSFEKSSLRYVPRLIHGFDEYVPTGSIYQDIDLIGFLRTHADAMEGGFACFCLPCQAVAIRNLIRRSGHDCILLGLVCSSQQTLEATECLLKLLHVGKNDVESLRYRGEGWPGGIRIALKDGTRLFVENNGSVWTDIFHSRLCSPARCLYCRNTLNDYADISLADPWLPEFRKKAGNGDTLVVGRTELGMEILREAVAECALEPIGGDKMPLSQQATIRRKEGYAMHPGRRKWLRWLRKWNWYKKLVFSSSFTLKIHRKLLSRFKL